ncbi:hypothetical protein [Mesorhizobium muleiense]|jgi:hypothetical protein|uniref:hypothetical protein n=1 Tax=Mesorhizobium muleiense TaxID=1004279 RepID=UPI001F3F92FA|nr:hypothetical protein [Mesorhizobium muleiense]MCF6114741.1 hypothetical protein [Mesorhizobium muleiense]
MGSGDFKQTAKLEHPSSVAFGDLPQQGEKGRPRVHSANKIKNRRQLASDAGHLGFGIVALDFSKGETEVGSIRRRPVGGGLGVYEPVPDRTVSGNTRKFVGDWGISAVKRRQDCGEASPISTGVFINVTGHRGNVAPPAFAQLGLQFHGESANFD